MSSSSCGFSSQDLSERVIISGRSCNDFVPVRWSVVLAQLSNADPLHEVQHQRDNSLQCFGHFRAGMPIECAG
jgi:hypothetical protein